MDRDRSSRDRDREDDRSSSRSRDRDEDRGSRSTSRDRDDSTDRDRDSSRSRDRGEDSGTRGSRDRDGDRGGRRESFSYSPRSKEQIDKRAKMRGKEFDRFVKEGVKNWKPNDGVNIIRILPATWKGAEHYGLDLYVHYSVGPDRQSYLDLAKMQDKPDPISEEHAEALRDGDDKYAKELDSKRRCGVYLIDRENEKEGVQFWAMPWTVDADINKLSVDRRTGETLNIDDPEDGYDVEFEKNGKDRNTKYEGVAIARRSSPLGSKKWLEFAMDNPIPEQLVYFDYEHIAKAFGGGGSHRDRDDGREDEREERGRNNEDRGGRSRGRDDQDQDAELGGRDRDRSSRDREDATTGSSRDRDDRGASRDEDRNSGSRGRGREDDRGSRTRRGRDEPAHSWESIHDMTLEELESFCESESALQDVNPSKADGRTDLADWICEELKIKKVVASSRRRIEEEDGGARREDDSSDRLRKMREERNR